MKNSIIMGAVLGCVAMNFEVNAERPLFYLGTGLVSNWLDSDFEMGYEYDNTDLDWSPNHPNAYAKHKTNKNKITPTIFTGIKTSSPKGLFWAVELGYNFSNIHHRHDFTSADNAEMEISNSQDLVSNMHVKHGHEISFLSKLGYSFDKFRTYGILGISSKKISMDYTILQIPGVSDTKSLHKSKRVQGLILGAGIEKDICKKFSIALEYKYKLYRNAKFDVDFKQEANEAFGGAHDNSDRNFKVKSHHHDVALTASVNL